MMTSIEAGAPVQATEQVPFIGLPEGVDTAPDTEATSLRDGRPPARMGVSALARAR
jgi:hypothetical protein